MNKIMINGIRTLAFAAALTAGMMSFAPSDADAYMVIVDGDAYSCVGPPNKHCAYYVSGGGMQQLKGELIRH